MKILLTAGAFIISAFAAASGAMAYSPQSSDGSLIAAQSNIASKLTLVTDRQAEAVGSETLIKVADRRDGRRGRRGGRHERHSGRRHRGRDIGTGVAIGVFGAIVAGALSEQAAAEEAQRCSRLDRRCERGNDDACDEFYATCE